MKVKIGDVEYDSDRDPIMVILSENDRAFIIAVEDPDGRYLKYPDGTDLQWVDAWANDKPFDCDVCASVNAVAFDTWPRCSDCCDMCGDRHGEYCGESNICEECSQGMRNKTSTGTQ